MSISHQLHNLARFKAASQNSLEPGDIYVHNGHLSIRGDMDGRVVLCPLSGEKAGMLGASSHADDVAKLDRDLRLFVEALTPPIAPPRKQSWHGLLILTESGWTLAGSATRMREDPDCGGDNAISIQGGMIDTYRGTKAFILRHWRVSWLDDFGRPVLVIACEQNAAAP